MPHLRSAYRTALPECLAAPPPVTFRVCSSPDGYYLGTFCSGQGPFSRESEYYSSSRRLRGDLRQQTVRWRS